MDELRRSPQATLWSRPNPVRIEPVEVLVENPFALSLPKGFDMLSPNGFIPAAP
jgi:hypothetical protein